MVEPLSVQDKSHLDELAAHNELSQPLKVPSLSMFLGMFRSVIDSDACRLHHASAGGDGEYPVTSG
jgi:hypothetical protein